MASTAAQPPTPTPSTIKALDKLSVHRIASGQVIVDLQTAVKELVENSLDAGATTIEVRFKQYGLASVEVVDNGCGIAEEDWECVGLKHFTSKISTFDDLSTVHTFGFRGEAISSLCAVCESVVVTTATQGPMGTQLELDQCGKVRKTTKTARQRGTSMLFTNIFATLPVRRKELQRNIKREFGKALSLLNAYALGPCAGMDSSGRGVRLTVTNVLEKGQKVPQIKTDGAPSLKASMTALWGPKAMDNTVELDLSFRAQRDKSSLKRINEKYSQDTQPRDEDDSIPIKVKGLISKFAVGCGRTGTDRQFFYINGRPCNLPKMQKVFNEVYRTFNSNQSPFVLADFILPTECCDVNVSPDKRTIFLQNEQNLVDALKDSLDTAFSSHRSTFDVNPTQRTQGVPSKTPFNSPFSARLNIKTASKPEAVPRTDAPKDVAHPTEPKVVEEPQKATSNSVTTPPNESEGIRRPVPKTIDELMKESSSERGKARQIEDASSIRKAGPEARPVTRRIDELMKASGSGKGKARQIEDTSSTREAGQRETSPEAQMSLDTAEAGPASLDLMDVDPSSEPGPSRRKDATESVVVDTTKASWAQFKRKETAVEQHMDKASEPVEEAEQPVAKKRRVEGEADQVVPMHIAESTGAKSKKLNPVGNLRSRLAHFASGGSQPADIGGEKPAPVEEDSLEEEEETVNEREDRGKKRPNGLAGFLIKPLDKGKGKSRNKLFEPEQDEDVPMDDDIVPATSSTIGVPENGVTKDNDFVDADAHPAMGIPDSAAIKKNKGKRPEVIRNTDTSDVVIRFDLSRLEDTWKRKQNGATETLQEAHRISGKVSAEASLTNTEDNEGATRALERIIDKADFANMDVIGQFNLGFILVRRRKAIHDDQGSEGGVMDDLFIVDQHAADEKYNFETLQQTTKIQSQRLFKPRPLEATAADELIVTENIEVLRQNGFEIEVDEAAAAGQGAKFQVTAFPVSKNTDFDMKDLEELIHLMQDQPAGRMVRCSKARAMFAMRACRKSVMIGTALNQNQMTTVVQHMGAIDQPWNCPHGRPTMRHLIDLRQIGVQRSPRKINWSSFID